MHTVKIAPGWIWAFLAPLLLLWGDPLLAFRLDNRWTVTATPGDGVSQGSPAIVTWSIVPDGTAIPGKPWLRPTESDSPSNVVDFFDNLYGDGGGGPLAERPWFSLFQSAADRWSQLSGLTFVYESNDDGTDLYTTLFNSAFDGLPGELGVRGDVRIGGHYIDGEVGANTLAYNTFPNAGEMVIDTSNAAFFGDLSSDSRAVRNVIMHELGHAIGVRHMDSSSAAFLMESATSSAFDGPQLDDILAVHRWYGDALEKSNALEGNDAPATATSLGAFTIEGEVRIGTDGGLTFVPPTAADFVSIDDNSDLDYYRFSLSHPGIVSVELIPQGFSYMEGAEGQAQSLFHAAAQSDLSLTLFEDDGTTEIAAIDEAGLGGTEELSLILSEPGDYFLRVSGSHDAVQLYELGVSYRFVPGDVNLDGVFDVSGNPETDDLLAFIRGWKRVSAADDYVTARMKGDLNLDSVSDLKDAFLMRRALIAAGAGHMVMALENLGSEAVPEPASLKLGLGAIVFVAFQVCRRKTT